MNWFFKRRMKKGRPMSTKGFGDGINGMDNCLATMTCQGGQVVRENGQITIIPNGSEADLSNSYYWHDFTATATTETGEFKTTNNVTVGGLRADDAVATIGTDTDKFQSAYFKNLDGSGYGPNFNITPSSIGTAFTAGYTDASSIISMFGCGASYGLNIVDTTNSRVVQLCNSTNAIQTTGDADIGGLVKISGAQVLTSPGAVVNNAATAVGTGTSGGYGFASLGEFNTFIANHNALVGTVNALLARVRLSTGHGLIVG